ncbi:MAG: A/G-specific adenine glycosylase [Lachnospiraceae bacterium]|nr:A/G-specific adenine glycosylase [Lachnospiraceae bacterium]
MNIIVEPLLDWYASHARDLPWRGSPGPYHVWLSEIMLQQTRVEAVKGYYERFLQALPDVSDLAVVEEDRLMKLWQGLGYYNRARNLQRAAQVICTEYGGRFPQEYDEWLALPGIGEYTAGAITSIALGKKEPAVDGNVYRIYTRLEADDTDITGTAFKRRVREEIKEILPDNAGAFNQALMDLGAVVCIPNGEPHCSVCPIAEYCKAYQQGNMTDYPNKPAKKKRRIEKRTIFLLEYQGKYLIQKRPSQGLLAGMWEFPGQDGHLSLEALRENMYHWKLAREIKLLGSAKHIFSHVEWHMLGYELSLLQLPGELQGQGIFCDRQMLREEYSIPSAFSFYLDYLFDVQEKCQD